jgi:hypothetical protein
MWYNYLIVIKYDFSSTGLFLDITHMLCLKYMWLQSDAAQIMIRDYMWLFDVVQVRIPKYVWL